MHNIITNHVLPGSIIHTDYWRAYNGIVEWQMDFEHRAVNHQEGFINDEGTHTNTIEGNTIYSRKKVVFIQIINIDYHTQNLGTWNGVKIRCFPRARTRKGMPWVLLEFIWRRKYFGDLFGGMMKSLREVDFVPGGRDIPWFTEYGRAESDSESIRSIDGDNNSETEVEENEDSSDIDSTDEDYRPSPPSNSRYRNIINEEEGVGDIGPNDITGDPSVQQNSQNDRSRRRMDDEDILPFGVVRRSRRLRITNISSS